MHASCLDAYSYAVIFCFVFQFFIKTMRALDEKQRKKTRSSLIVNSGPSLPKARHKPERRGGGKTGMIDVNGKNNKVEQKNKKKIKTMGDVTLKGYDMTNTVTKGTGVRVHKQ